MRLLRANTADVWGASGDPGDWWYRLTLTGPRTTRTVTAPAAQVVHLRYATERHAPQRGIAPLQYASLTGSLTASLEQALGYEAGGAVANLIALPEGFGGSKSGDGDDDDDGNGGGGLTEAIRTAKGRTLLPETTSGGYGDRQGAPGRDWKPERLGADPPDSLVRLRTAVENTVLGVLRYTVAARTRGHHRRHRGARSCPPAVDSDRSAARRDDCGRTDPRTRTADKARVWPTERHGGPCRSSARSRRPGESGYLDRRRDGAYRMVRCLTRCAPWRRIHFKRC